MNEFSCYGFGLKTDHENPKRNAERLHVSVINVHIFTHIKLTVDRQAFVKILENILTFGSNFIQFFFNILQVY